MNSKYTARDGVELDLFIFSPSSSSSSFSSSSSDLASDSASSSSRNGKEVLIFFHGGGCVVVSPQYRLAPEWAFPTTVEDAWDAFLHVAATHASADVPAGLVVGGASHGAVLASLIAVRAKETPATPTATGVPRPAITGLYFAAGAFVGDPATTVPESHRGAYLSRNDERCVSAPILDATTKAVFDAALAVPDLSSPLYRALNVQPLARHAGLAPKIYFQMCGMDIVRDDGFIYADLLRGLSGGVEVREDVYEGAPHVFWSVFPATKLAGRWRSETRAGVGWLFGTKDGDVEEAKI